MAPPYIAAPLHELGSVCNREGNYAKAREYYERSLAMHHKVHGEGVAHPSIATSLHRLGTMSLSEEEMER